MKRDVLISVVGIAVGVIVIVAGITLLYRSVRGQGVPGMSDETIVPLVDQHTLAGLVHKSVSSANTSHLGAGVIPPTNTWLSGMVLQQTPDAVYPMPLSFLAKDTGFEIGLPTVTSTTTQISGEHVPGIVAHVPATTFQLTRFDKISATLTYREGPQTIGSVTLAEGSPFVFYTAAQADKITFSAVNPADIHDHTSQYVRYVMNGQTYVLTSSKAVLSVVNGVISASLNPNDVLTMYALTGSGDPLRQYAGNVVHAVQVTHSQAGSSIQTTLNYQTVNHKATIVAPLPYTNTTGHSVMSYQSMCGQMQALAGNTFTSSVPVVVPSDELNLGRLTEARKQSLITMLDSDVATTTIPDQDSYTAGKELARAANLLAIAEQLSQTDTANHLKSILNQAFAARLTGQYFYYDTTLKGVAATMPGFGSQDFNDHHFHYGYWLYAGSILAKYEGTFIDKYKNQMNLLAADIAMDQTSNQFPLERTYDPYAEHSWAAGLAPFADGNNQESSSEAIHAWNGVSLWGEVTNNHALRQTGIWMLSNEAHSAAATWRSVNTSGAGLSNYTSPVVGINFGGKRVYSTWFSDDPTAKLSIQLIPMDPAMTSFSSDKQIANVVTASVQNNNFNVSLGDYALMYLALANPQQAAILAQQQTNIDNGDSKTYLNAFIYTQLDK